MSTRSAEIAFSIHRAKHSRKPPGPCIYSRAGECAADRPRCPHYQEGACASGGVTAYCGRYYAPKFTRDGGVDA